MLLRLWHFAVFTNMLMHCELLGEWTKAMALILIALLPKGDGDLREIGLLPLMPRILMRARRSVMWSRERAHQAPFVYAGVSRGADIAAWRQAANVELAAAMGLEYAKALLDLVKAFDRIPHPREGGTSPRVPALVIAFGPCDVPHGPRYQNKRRRLSHWWLPKA